MLVFKGSPGSPYTRKMLALLRYRQIPHRLLANADTDELPQPKVALLPTFYLHDESGVLQAVTDTTPLLRRFESEFDGRSVIPANPVLRFIDYLLEDYADEWLTKPMFHYRWHYAADAEKATAILPYWHDFSADDTTIATMQTAFRQRQQGRLHVVGSNEQTKALIENSYRQLLGVLQAHLGKHRFLMGDRPGASDFATFGQLTCLAQFDPTPAAIALSSAPRVYAWVGFVEDLSGARSDCEQWLDSHLYAETYRPLLREVGRTYAPVMVANAQAADSGEKEFETIADGTVWRQQTFAYQRKCLAWIREAYQDLTQSERDAVDTLLDGSGCEMLVN